MTPPFKIIHLKTETSDPEKKYLLQVAFESTILLIFIKNKHLTPMLLITYWKSTILTFIKSLISFPLYLFIIK